MQNRIAFSLSKMPVATFHCGLRVIVVDVVRCSVRVDAVKIQN